MSAVAQWGRTRRLALREFAAGDADALARMHADPRLTAQLVDAVPLHLPAVARLFVERMAAIYRAHEGLGIWHASVPGDAAPFAGFFSLMPLAAHAGEIELGSRLVPGHWGGGLAFEGCELLLDHAFERLGHAHVWGVCHPDNRSARGVLAALGFEALGLQPYDGVPALHHRIGMNAWRALRNTPRGTRLRRALRAAAGSEPAEEPAACATARRPNPPPPPR